MRQNVPIDEILNSLKKMMDNKTSRISKYLELKEEEEEDYNHDEYEYNNDDSDEILELTEEAILPESKKMHDDKNEKNPLKSQEIKSIYGHSEIRIPENKNNDAKSRVSEKTSAETSIYLKYLSDKSAMIKSSKEKTINEFISEAAMPYIIDWLDKNLNKLVKDIVEKEIKRITSDEK